MYGDLQAPDLYPGPLRRPQTPTNSNTSLISDYYNRAALENQVSLNYMKEGRNAYVDEKGKSLMPEDVIIPSSPSLQFIPDDVIWKGIRTTNRPYNEYTRVPGADALRYNTPDTIEGDAAHYEDYTPTNNKPIMGMYGLEDTLGYKQGGLIKRVDGSYSRRGLWDNIRANKGSGRKPTAAMLEQERKIKKHADGGWIDMYGDGDVVTGGNPPSKLQELTTQYQAIQDQVNKGNTNKNAYVENMRKTADDLIAKEFNVNTVFPEYARNGNNCIGTACNLADQAGDKFYSEGNTFFIDNALAAKYAKDNPKASRYLEQDERFLEPGDIIQFKRKGDEKAGPYHAFTVYSIGDPNADGDRVVTVVGTHGSGPMVKEDAYILGKDNKLYSNLYGSRDTTPHATQLLKRREGSDNSYNELVTQRDALKQEILKIDPQYFTPNQDIRSGDYKQTAFMLNDQGQGNEYGQYVQTKDLGADRYGNKLVPGVNIQTLNPGMVDQAYNARSYIDATNSGLTDILTKYSDPQYKYDYMRSHNISNAEYDALVSNMVGIYGAESKFGTDYTANNKLPEWPWATKMADKLGIINQEEKSIGPFQLKYNQLPEAYRKTIKGHDLYDANIAADATMEYLTAGLPLLRKRANTTAETATEDNPYSQNITKDNYLEYVPYLYNMRGWLKGDEATMENKGDILRGDSGYKNLVDQYSNNILQSFPSSLTTPEPLEIIPQQRNGGYIQKPCCDGNMYGNGSTVTTNKPPQKTLKQTLLDYKEGADENKWEFIDISGLTSWDDAARGHESWKKSGRTLPTLTEGMDMFSAVPLLGKAKKIGMGMKVVANSARKIPWNKVYGAFDYLRDEYNDKINKKEDGSWVADSSIPTPTTPSFYDAGQDRTLTNYQMGTPKARMYAAGSTVWTNQDTPLWAAGTPTPTSTQNFKNTGSLNTSRYRIGDVIPTGMDYKSPAAGTYDYNKDIQPPKEMVLHAPDTTMMAKHGGYIKKHVNSPRVYGSPINPQGMFQGPTSQRGGMMFGNGSTVGGGYDQAKAQYIAASNKGIMLSLIHI
jgi:hypothetical protein